MFQMDRIKKGYTMDKEKEDLITEDAMELATTLLVGICNTPIPRNQYEFGFRDGVVAGASALLRHLEDETGKLEKEND